MSNENETEIQHNSQQTVEPNVEPSKGRQPDYVVHTVNGDDKNARWTQLGAAWTGNNGYIKAKVDAMPANGELIFQPRAELERLRAERKNQQPDQQPHQDIPLKQ